MLEVLFLVLRNLHSVPIVAAQFTFPPAVPKGSLYPTSSPTLLVSCSLTVPAWPLLDTSRSEGVLHSPADPGLLQRLLVQQCSRNRWGVRERAHPLLFTRTLGRASPGFCGAWHWLKCLNPSLGKTKKEKEKNSVTAYNTDKAPKYKMWPQVSGVALKCFQRLRTKSKWTKNLPYLLSISKFQQFMNLWARNCGWRPNIYFLKVSLSQAHHIWVSFEMRNLCNQSQNIKCWKPKDKTVIAD